MMLKDMQMALKVPVSCLGTEAEDSDIEGIAEDYNVDYDMLRRHYLAAKRQLESWLDGVLSHVA